MKFKTKLSIAAMFMAVLMLLTSCTKTGTTSSGSESEDKTKAESSSQNSSQSNEDQSALFDEYINKYFLDDITADTFSLHQYLRNPEDFGIDSYEITWGNYSYPTQEEIDEEKEILKKITSIDREQLTLQQKQDYDVFKYYADLFDDSMKYYYHDEPLEVGNGFHATVSIALCEYLFLEQQDIKDYLELCSQVGEVMDKVIDFEKEKSQRGLFMTDACADQVIEGCESFLDAKDSNAIITSFDSRVDKFDGLDEETKRKYKEKNKQLYFDVIAPAYERLITELEKLKGTGKNELGIAHFESGKEYYEYCLKDWGVEMTAQELIDKCDEILDGFILKYSTLLLRDMDLAEKVQEDCMEDMTPQECVDFWIEAAREDFPALEDGLNYTIENIDDSLSKSLSSVYGYYMLPSIDGYKSDNMIRLNPLNISKPSDQMYFTLAHEAYPGHMLQNTYKMGTDISNYRKSLNVSSYSEGWTTYIEDYVYKYIDISDTERSLRRLMADLNLALTLRFDIGVNYEGWTKEQMNEYIQNSSSLSQLELQDNNTMFEIFQQNPLLQTPYIAGYFEVKDLKSHYKEELGSDFSELDFHTAYIETGDVPFSILRQIMDESLLDAKPQSADAA